MRGAKTLMLILASSVTFLAASAMAVSGTNAPPAPTPPVPVKLGADVNSLVFTGTIKKISGQAVLVTSDATYVLASGNFDGIVGLKVNIIGKIIQEDAIEKIMVARVQLARN
ncbi:MAG TPA: hypothetical protein VJ969_10025 [Desulfopila sp.]|nr:hypothetical protein [Desulfopila sp.]